MVLKEKPVSHSSARYVLDMATNTRLESTQLNLQKQATMFYRNDEICVVSVL